MNNNPFEVDNSKSNQAPKDNDVKQVSKKRITAEESTDVLRKNILKGSLTMISILIGSMILYPPVEGEIDLDQSFDQIIADISLSETEFYEKYEIEPLTEPWQWNPDDFIDYDLEDADYYDFMLYDNFSGEDDTLTFKTKEEEQIVDLSTIIPGIYTIENTSEHGYIDIGFGDHDDYLAVYNNQPIYNIPIMEDTVIKIKNLDYGESNKVEFKFTKQDDYINHDQEHIQGMFITGKSMFDNVEYGGESQKAFYPKPDSNRLDSEIFDEANIYNVPGSVFFSN